tara:strand:- start:2172 stop:2837 length:666 start_codon:yes stop_codon:yes gene_type:complete
MIISIEGNIGTGKSTLISLLRDRYKNVDKICFVDEPLEEWLKLKDTDGENILEKFYKDQTRWSYSFQMNAFITRSKNIISADPSKNIVIIERSVITDRRVFAEILYSSGKISKLEWELYEQWYNWLLNDYNVKPDIYIYLRCTPEVSFSRMKQRSRKEEDVVPKEYIDIVSNKHDDWLLNEHQSAVVTIDVNNDFEKDMPFRENILEIFGDILNGQLEKMR